MRMYHTRPSTKGNMPARRDELVSENNQPQPSEMLADASWYSDAGEQPPATDDRGKQVAHASKAVGVGRDFAVEQRDEAHASEPLGMTGVQAEWADHKHARKLDLECITTRTGERDAYKLRCEELESRAEHASDYVRVRGYKRPAPHAIETTSEVSRREMDQRERFEKAAIADERAAHASEQEWTPEYVANLIENCCWPSKKVADAHNAALGGERLLADGYFRHIIELNKQLDAEREKHKQAYLSFRQRLNDFEQQLAAEREQLTARDAFAKRVEKELAAERSRVTTLEYCISITKEARDEAQASLKPLVEALEWYAKGTLMTKVAKEALAKV